MHKNLKGALNLNALASIALMFVIVAIVLAMGGRILTDVQTEMIDTAYETVTNEGPYTFANATDAAPYNLNTTYYPVTSITIFNGTSVLIISLNYSVVDASSGQYNITNWNNSLGDTESVEVNYTYSRNEYGMSYNATGRGLEGIGTFADWLPLLAIIIISVIVITMLMGGFGKSLGGGRA